MSNKTILVALTIDHPKLPKSISIDHLIKIDIGLTPSITFGTYRQAMRALANAQCPATYRMYLLKPVANNEYCIAAMADPNC